MCSAVVAIVFIHTPWYRTGTRYRQLLLAKVLVLDRTGKKWHWKNTTTELCIQTRILTAPLTFKSGSNAEDKLSYGTLK